RLHLLAHALEAASARLQVGDANHVFVAHPQGEKTPGFVGELVFVCSAVEIHDRLEAVQVEPRVAAILKASAARRALFEHRASFLWEALPDAFRAAQALLFCRCHSLARRRSARGVEARRKTSEARLGAPAARADR